MIDDLLAGARVLSRLPDALRSGCAKRLLLEAHAAHHYTKRLGRPHPQWGNGSLMARALAELRMDILPPQPCFGALATMATAIDDFRRRQLHH